MTAGPRGERGQHGDHGQDGKAGVDGVDGHDGRDGADGREGLQGRPGEDLYEDPAINQAIAEALGEKRLRSTDKRVLILFLIGCVAFGSGLYLVERELDTFRGDVFAVCTKTNEDNAKVNAVIERLSQSARSNPMRTPEQREQIAQTYRGLRLPISECPPA